MLYKITIISTRGFNSDKAEIGMSVEISSKKLTPFFYSSDSFNIPDNNDKKVVNTAFKEKYGIDLFDEGLLVIPTYRYLKCEKLG